ncbi:MAG: phosphatidylserine decarboxylase [Myxococcales bacterium]|nr:phosphatidylserine decarboxylase [Myxococcales bacterium]MCB9544785.1 phosphatidylserine decarboxylase [Myxococcales bacterium]
MNDALFIGALRLLPKNAWSRAVGAAAYSPLPRAVHRAAIRAFARAYQVDVDEADRPLDEYRTVGEFFTRRLRPGARPIDRRPGFAVSPADGHILNSGRIQDGTLIQAKGRDFSVAELLRDEAAGARFAHGSWVTVYLSPRDYHRVHHPAEGRIVAARHVPGHLWPVNRAAVEHVDQLFCVNERIITHVEGPLGEVATIMVGATSVGHITVRYDDGLVTNRGGAGGGRTYDAGHQVARGDELGTFHLGSTAIVLFADPAVALEPLEEGAPIRLGTAIARRVGK